MVYARLADGREYLFTGDVAKFNVSWRERSLPARFAAHAEPGAVRAENLAWLATIDALHRSAPHLMIVTGHEPGKIPFSSGTFSD